MSLALFVVHESFCELVGAGGALAANDTAEFFYQIVYLLPYGEFGYALKIAAASVYEFNACEYVVFVNLVNYLAAASFLRSERFHFSFLLIFSFLVYKLLV